MPLLEVRDLRTWFCMPGADVRAVDGVSFSLEAGRVLALVGESGCGKSATSLSILRLLPHPGRIVSGSILFEGKDLAAVPESAMRRLRGGAISLVFQDPGSALNPVLTCGFQLIESIRRHRAVNRSEARSAAVELLRDVGIPDPGARLNAYPHELSGGMRQRVMIAMALASRPRLLIADEPTTALDVTVQAQILELLASLRDRYGMGILLITHDLGVVADLADAVAVMYAGRIVENGPVETVCRFPRHPYTRALLDAIPPLTGSPGELSAVEGAVPDPRRYPSGCRFHPRCPRAGERCAQEEPPFDDGVACFHPMEARA